jgi:hypothetical protein
MDDRSDRRLVDQLAGEGWLLLAGIRIGQVSYALKVYDVRTSQTDHTLTGIELAVRLLNHSIDPQKYAGQLLTLALNDRRFISGFISEDGSRLVRTGVLT